jgi:hypothetical protein
VALPPPKRGLLSAEKAFVVKENHRLFQPKDMLDCGRTAHGCVGGSERAFQFLNKKKGLYKKNNRRNLISAVVLSPKK